MKSLIDAIKAALKPMSVQAMLQQHLEDAERQLVETIQSRESYTHNENLLRARIARIRDQQAKGVL